MVALAGMIGSACECSTRRTALSRTCIAPRLAASSRAGRGGSRGARGGGVVSAVLTPEARKFKTRGEPEFLNLTYQLPTWASFELGVAGVYWMTSGMGLSARPMGGEIVTVYYNPEWTNGKLDGDAGIAFNGGFNGPFMCADAPRLMAAKERGPNCMPLFSIRLHLPRYTRFVQFSFTDGTAWDDGPAGTGYVMECDLPADLRGKSFPELQAGLALEMTKEGACAAAIFPDPVPVTDRCKLPTPNVMALSCPLEIRVGNMDTSSSDYDPDATHAHASCELPMLAEPDN